MPFWWGSKGKNSKSQKEDTSNGASHLPVPEVPRAKKFINLLKNDETEKRRHSNFNLEEDFYKKIDVDAKQEHKNAAGSRLKKKISTVAEETDRNSSNREENTSEDSSDSEDDSSTEGQRSSKLSMDSFEEENEEEESEEEEEEHSHAIMLKMGDSEDHMRTLASHVSNFIEVCGLLTPTNRRHLTHTLNEDLKRTFSVLGSDAKIFRLPSSLKDPNCNMSAVSDKQLELIRILELRLNKLVDTQSDVKKQYELMSGSRTLFERYGVVREVVGKGASGLVSIIDPQVNNSLSSQNDVLTHALYAVKQLLAIKKQSKEKAIDKILSEFIISSTLNHKNIIKTVDLMVELPILKNSVKSVANELKIYQVVEFTIGRDLFGYIKSMTQSREHFSYMSFEEVDCFIKQISKGVRYMHQHGVAHCDLKLENVLVQYTSNHPDNANKAGIILKLTDFGKSNVFRTKWDKNELLIPYYMGPMGSEPYVSPEEYSCLAKRENGFSPRKKDNWALGIIILVLYNIRRYFFLSCKGYDKKKVEYLCFFEQSKSVYLWSNTDFKSSKGGKEKVYKDKVFEDYVKKRMLAEYNESTKEWLIKRAGTFRPIEELFTPFKGEYDEDEDEDEDDEDKSKRELEQKTSSAKEIEDLSCNLRKFFIYGLLDPSPATRLTVENLLRGDWLKSVDTCN